MSAYRMGGEAAALGGAILYAQWTSDPARKTAQERVLANPGCVPHLWAIFADCTVGSVEQGNHVENEPFTVDVGREARRR